MSWRAIMGADPPQECPLQYSRYSQESGSGGISEDIENNGDSVLISDPAADDVEWPERAAIAEHDGGLSRADAEAPADACRPASVPPVEPPDWLAWYRAEVSARSGLGRLAAERRVWGMAINLWHRLHGDRPDPSRCAGCGEPVGRGHGCVLPDDAVVHDGRRLIDCLSAYGSQWRWRAADGLAERGLEKPEGVDDD